MERGFRYRDLSSARGSFSPATRRAGTFPAASVLSWMTGAESPLPGVPNVSGVSATPHSSERPDLTGKRVVVCEDEGVTQMQLRRALVRAGLSVVGSAMNGQEGIEITLRERPDIVLMDIRMPIMDGLEAARQILAAYPVCIVMLTAFADETYQEQAKALGASGYIHKPITSDVLVPMLQEAFARFLRRPQGQQD